MLVRPELTKARLARVPKLTKSPASHHAARTPHQPPLTARARPSPTQGLLCGSGTGHGDSPIRLASRVSRSAAYLGAQAEAGAGRCVARSRTPREINSAPQCASAIERQAPRGHQPLILCSALVAGPALGLTHRPRHPSGTGSGNNNRVGSIPVQQLARTTGPRPEATPSRTWQTVRVQRCCYSR